MHDIHIDRYADGSSRIHRLDPRAKLLGLLVLVVVQVITEPRHVGTFALHAAVLVSLIALSRLPLRYVAARFALILPFVFLAAAFAPFLPAGGVSTGAPPVPDGSPWAHSGWMVFWNAVVKGSLGALALILLSSTTRFPDLLKGLEKLRAPQVFVLLLGVAYRYLFVFADEATSLARALRCRGFRGRWIWHSGIVGRLLGSLFLRACERGERVHMAMVSRGFDGTVKTARPLSFQTADAAFVAAMLLAAMVGQAFRLFIGGGA